MWLDGEKVWSAAMRVPWVRLDGVRRCVMRL